MREYASPVGIPWLKNHAKQITFVVICYGVLSIGRNAFFECVNLKSVVIANSVASIGENAFLGCGKLTSVAIPDSVETVGAGAFFGCGISSIKIPRSVISFSGNPFAECHNLTVINTSENSNFVLVDGVLMDKEKTQIISCTLYKSKKYDIPNTVEKILPNAFRGCNRLVSVTIPNSVTSIGWSAFLGCTALTTATVPASVKSIGHHAFDKCSNLRTD